MSPSFFAVRIRLALVVGFLLAAASLLWNVSFAQSPNKPRLPDPRQSTIEEPVSQSSNRLEADSTAVAAGHAFKLPGVTGGTVEVTIEDAPTLTVVCFLGTECPLARLYAPRIQQLADEFQSRGVRFVGINSNRQDSVEEIQAYAAEHGLKIALVKDHANLVAERYGATRTPEVFVLNKQLGVQYHGRIDDQYQPGVFQAAVGREDLRLALEELLSGKPVSVSRTEITGCLIGRIKQRPATTDITYCREVSRILKQHCTECHQTGEIGPFALTDYEDVVAWADTLLESINSGRMPPWHADPKHGRFRNGRSMPAEDKRLLAEWVAGGTPYGDPSALENEPTSERAASQGGWQLPVEPNVILPMRDRPYAVPAEGTVEYQYFVVDPGFDEDKWITGAQVLPGNRSVVHHCIVFVRPPDGSRFQGVGWLTGYVPGQRASMLPPASGRRIQAGSTLVFQMHYTPNGSPQQDLTRVGLIFGEPDQMRNEVYTLIGINQDFEIPPHKSAFPVTASPRGIPAEGQLLAIVPHMHVRGRSFRVEASQNSKSRILLNVPKYDFNWQHIYELQEPLPLAEIEQLEFTATFDNSAANPVNPDPTQYVTWGDQTWEEMAVAFFEVSVPRTASRSQPKQVPLNANRKRMIEEYVERFLRRFDANSDGEVDRSEVPLSIDRFGFHLLDKNRDERISRSELRSLAEQRVRE